MEKVGGTLGRVRWLLQLSKLHLNGQEKRAAGARHRTHQLPTSFRPFPTRQNNSAAAPSPTRPVSTAAPLSRPPSFFPRRTYLIPHALLHPNVLRKSRLCPVSPDAALVTTHRLHAFDHTRPNRSTVLGSRMYPAEGHRLAMFPTDSRIATIPSVWLGWLPLTRHRSISDTADHLEKATALLLTVWVFLLSRKKTLKPLRPLFTATLE